MNMIDMVGEQLSGQLLHERQEKLRLAPIHLPGPVIVAVDLKSPENIGAVLRLADAAASTRVMFINAENLDLKRVHRAARNCETFIEWDLCTLEQFLEKAVAYQPLIALELTTASTSIFETDLPEKCAIIVGGEQHGIPAKLLIECQQAVHIPMYGINGSMNVTHALAVALFEWRRQRS